MALPTGFVRAVDPGGTKRLVPEHYLDNPELTKQGFKLPPSTRKKKVEEPAAPATHTTVTEPAAAGENKEVSE
jgi:hypothetical protein